MWWFVLAIGAAFALVPNIVDPSTGFNGAVLVGVGLLLWAGFKLGAPR